MAHRLTLALLAALAFAPGPATWCAEVAAEPNPPVDGKWGAQEYASAYQQLVKSVRDGRPLPALSDPEGRKLLQRIAAAENLDLLADTKLSLDKRMPEMLGILQNVNGIYKLYAGALVGGKAVQGECLAIQVFLMRLTVRASCLSDEFMKSLSPDDPKMEVRRDGLNKMRRGFQMMIIGFFVDACQERSIFSDEQCISYFTEAREVMPSLVACMDVQTYGQLADALEARRKSAKSEPLRKAAAQLLDVLRSGAPGFPGSLLMAEVQRQLDVLDKTGLRIEAPGEALPGGGQWGRYKSEGGQFSVELPGRPVVIGGELKGEKEKGGSLHLLQVQDAFQVKYVAACCQRSPAGKKDSELIEELFQLKPGEKKNIFADRREIETDGHKGYEFSDKSDASSAIGRVFIVDGKAYFLLAECPRTVADTAAKDIQKFLGSLKIEKGK